MVSGGVETKVSTSAGSLDTMATLPISVSRHQQHPNQSLDKSLSALSKDKELDTKSAKPNFVFHQLKRTSMFVVLSLLYGKLIIVACIGVIVSQEITKSIPVQYYEGFFTFLFGVSIIFLIYLLCFLVQDSSCCSGNGGGEKKTSMKKVKDTKKDKNKRSESVATSGTADGAASQTQTSKNRPNILQREVYPQKKKLKMKTMSEGDSIDSANDQSDETDTSFRGVGTLKRGKNLSEEKLTEASPDSIDIEATIPEVTTDEGKKRKTSQNVHHYGSSSLRIAAIGFGLNTMIYIGLQFGKIVEIPIYSPCYEILRALNPILHMVFTFMQMYFIFMNARLKIHRFKFIARFGLMHVAATNICVWIKVLVYESLNEMTRKPYNYFNFSRNIVGNMTKEFAKFDPSIIPQDPNEKKFPPFGMQSYNQVLESSTASTSQLFDKFTSHIQPIPYALMKQTTFSVETTAESTTMSTAKTTLLRTLSTVLSTLTPTYTTNLPTETPSMVSSTSENQTSASATSLVTNIATSIANETATVAETLLNAINKTTFAPNILVMTELPPKPLNMLNSIAEAMVRDPENRSTNDTCNKINIMGTIVEDTAPFVYPFVIEYSLIGAAVIFIMWRHIGRASRYVSEDNIEHRLEAILSQKAVVMAQVQNGGRVGCVGASKGLFFGLLVLVGSLIATILFFVLIHHHQFNWLAVYLADASHSTVMVLSLFAIFIGFCRAKNLRFYPAETTDLNDILLRVSAFGLFIYSIFSIIAGARYALIKRENLLVLITGTITIFQVVLQLLFIGDMSRRHVNLSEHGRNQPGRQIITFLFICNITMCILFTFESQKVLANPVQLNFFGDKAWTLVEHITLPLCIFHRFHSAVALVEIWKNSYKPRLD